MVLEKSTIMALTALKNILQKSMILGLLVLEKYRLKIHDY